MERLAKHGMMFTAAYAQSLDTPSRCSILTGMNAARHRVTNQITDRDKDSSIGNDRLAPPDWAMNGIQPIGTAADKMKRSFTTATSLPQLLRGQGYATFYCGQAVFGARGTPGTNPLNFGFDRDIANSDNTNDVHGSLMAVTQLLSACHSKADETVKPFFLYFSCEALRGPAGNQNSSASYQDPNDGKPWNAQEREHTAMIARTDKALGDLLDCLDRNGFTTNTYIFFISANGGPALASTGRMGDPFSNYPLTAGKGSGFEGGIRVPMIVSGPGIGAGDQNDIHVIVDDLFPTILALAGAAKPQPTIQALDGRDLAPLLFRPRSMTTDWDQRPLLFHLPDCCYECTSSNPCYGPYTAVRMGSLKLLFTYSDRKFRLFDVEADPGEKRDLSMKRQYDCDLLKAIMRNLLKRYGAQMPVDKTTGKPADMP